MNTASNTIKTQRLRRAKPGDMAQLRAVLWTVLLEVEEIVTDQNTMTDAKLKGAHALASLAGSYAKVTEAHELEQRLAALEQRLAALEQRLAALEQQQNTPKTRELPERVARAAVEALRRQGYILSEAEA